MSPRALLARLRALDPHRLDLLVGALVAVEMQVEATLIDSGNVALRGLLLVLAACVAVRRRFPLSAFLVSLVPFVLIQSMDRSVTDHLFVALFVILFMSYSVAANTDGRRFWIAPPVAHAAGMLSTVADSYDDSGADDLLWIGLIVVAGPMVTGRLLRNRSQLQRALREKAERLERERRERAEQAVVDERTRIAGELHDIVAHALTEMTVQAGAAGRLTTRDPDMARAAFAAVEGSGRDALGELRRLLGVLRHSDEELALAPQPSLRHLDALARRAAAAGLPVEVRVEGDVSELPAGVDVTGYRVVQEALGGALRVHGADRAEVVVRYGGDAVEVEVSDDGRAIGAAGDAPIGLRERVTLYGGELQAAPRRDGGHVLRARLPREVPA